MPLIHQKLKRMLIVAGAMLLCGVLLLWGGHPALQTGAAPRACPIYSVETTEKKVALGINCAWGDEDVDQILNTLQEKGVRATFFLVGNWCDTYPGAAARIANKGHELGSHSQTHADMAKLDRVGIEQQLADSRASIRNATGQEVRLFRPPSGSYNDLCVSTARAGGYEVVQWDCDTLDWKGLDSAQLIERGTAKLGPGSILLLHAGAKHTAQALPQLLDEITARGYTFVPVGELILPQPYTIDHAGRQHAQS